jgi:integrase
MAKQRNIMRRGKSWVAYGRVNGVQFWRSFPTRDQAELFLARQLQRRANHQPPERFVRVSFEVAAEAWYRRGTTERGWKPSTRRDYRSVLDAHLLPEFRGSQLDKLTSARLRSWQTQSLSDGVPPRTVQKLQAVLHGIFAFARKEYGLPTNPADDVERLKLPGATALDFYSTEEIWALVRAAASAQDAALFLTAAFAGLRRGELVALRIRDVDFAKRTIRVEGSYAGGELTPPKSGKPRSVPMVGEVERTLAELLTERGNADPDDLVFLGKECGYLDASALRRRYVTAQEKAGIRKLRFHDLRHVFGSTAINRASIIQVQHWLGHADVKTTMRYLHHKSHAADADLLDGAFVAAQPVAPVAA